MKITEWLKSKPLMIDGAMGTMLFDAGLAPGKAPDEWNLLHPDVVTGIHTAYAEAGANLLLSNTFGTNALRLKNSVYSVEEIAAAGVRLAKAAAMRAKQPCYAALDVGPLGKMMKPYGELSIDEAEALFTPSIRAGAAEGADCVLIETMGDLNEVTAAVRAAKKLTQLPVFVTLTFGKTRRLFSGSTVRQSVETLEALGVDALGSNCGIGPEQMLDLLPEFVSLTKLPILMKPNAGLPKLDDDGNTYYDMQPDVFAAQMRSVLLGGAAGIGGCCGTTPAHIRAMTALCQ